MKRVTMLLDVDGQEIVVVNPIAENVPSPGDYGSGYTVGGRRFVSGTVVYVMEIKQKDL